MDKQQGIAFKAKREKDQLSAEALAKILKTTRESVYKWETGTVPRSKAMQKRVKDYINGELVTPPEKIKPKINYRTNGTVPHEDFKQKYYTLLEKYTALLEKK